MSRDWRLYLADVVEYADAALRISAGLTREELFGDERTRFAILHALQVVGEASKRVPREVRDRSPGIPWQDIAGFRDWLAHGYWGVRQDVVWSVLSHDLPRLRDAAVTLLAEADRADPPPA